MDEKGFFESLIFDCKTNTEKILKILEARGFFFDQKECNYYVSDNATYNDLQYLSFGFEKYGLGTVFLGKSQKHRNNNYEIIVPYTALVHISEGAEISGAISFFKESGRVGFSVNSGNREWYKFIYQSYGRKCDVKDLEPYVSFYVKAISACGVMTSFSCDGNHDHGGKMIVRSFYPDNLWQELIQEYCIKNWFPQIVSIEKGIEYNAENKYESFYNLYKAADYLYKNRIKLRTIKQRITKHFNRKIRHNYSEKELEEMFIELGKDYLEGIKNGDTA